MKRFLYGLGAGSIGAWLTDDYILGAITCFFFLDIFYEVGRAKSKGS